MAYIKKKSERKFKITVCNGYKVNGQKRMKAQTITVPSSVPKRGIQQYVMAEAERIEKKFKYGVEESDQTHFEQYAENWLKRQEPFFKATTYAGYKRNLDIVYPLIGGIPLAKLLPMTLEEMCEELRKRPGRGGNCIKETTVQKYLETVSSVLEDAKKNDIIPFNPAHRVRKKHFEKEVQHIPQKYEMSKLMRAIQNEPILYRAYYTLAITTGLRRGELCALQWRDITGACELTVRRSRSCAFTYRFKLILKANNLPLDLNVHSLRHTNASLLIAQGVDVRTVASLLGHAQASTTLDIYAHAFDKNKRKAQEKLGKAIGL